MRIDLFTRPWQKKQSQDTIIKFIKTLVNFMIENDTNDITYVRSVADKPNEIQHYWESLSNSNTQQKSKNIIFDKSKVTYIK